MADPKLIDYYAILNLPPTADLVGIETAYARLSSELAARSDVDETAIDALRRLNEAYGVLSKPSLRLEYDTLLFGEVLERERENLRTFQRRRHVVGNVVAASLGLLVFVQAFGLVYLGRDEIGSLLGKVLSPLAFLPFA